MSFYKAKSVFVTGANRGIGATLVRTLLERDAGKVYAAARDTASLPDFRDSRVVPMELDLLDEALAYRVAQTAADVDVLINNAGTARVANVLDGDMESLKADMDTNFFGTLNVLRAFVPQFTHRGAGTIANVVSVAALSASAPMGGYSASKAALHSVTQSLRAMLDKQGIRVVGIYPGPTETDMARSLTVQKSTPEASAGKILDGIANGDIYIFPDPEAERVGRLWKTDGYGLDAALANRASQVSAS